MRKCHKQSIIGITHILLRYNIDSQPKLTHKNMKVQIRSKHKSIPQNTVFELPKFSLFTGINGSGKSHLLEAIANTNISTVTINGEQAKNIAYVSYNGLNPQIIEQSDSAQVLNGISNFWNQVQNLINQYNQLRSQGHYIDEKTGASNYLNSHSSNLSLNLAIEKILKNTNKKLEDLSQEDISNDLTFAHLTNTHMPSAPMTGGHATNNQLFFSQTALIFKAYHTRLVKNQFAAYRAREHNASVSFLTNEEFLKKFGPPPWELINDILLRAGLPYQVTNPEAGDYELPYHLKLIDFERSVEISVNDLSSGEKVLMSLALAIYNTGNGGLKPNLLLLDEPDAPLHPHFSKLLIDIILETIVNKANVNVIMTTHSPSTVAMAPDGSIFEIRKEKKSPTIISNSQAIKTLTEGISYLRVTYNKRKQIFVESKYDVKYFQKIYILLFRKYSFDYEPVFLEPHSGTSNCTDVISIVNKLRDAGSDLAYGIIDFDGGNRSSNAVVVLGEGARYAIENYILDPLYLALTLIRNGKKSFSDFGVHGKNSYMDAFQISQSECQKIVNEFFHKIGIPITDLQSSTCENGFVINYPNSFLLHHGHDYEKLVLSKLPELNASAKGRGDAALKLGVIQVIEELPQFLSIDISKTLVHLLGIKQV